MPTATRGAHRARKANPASPSLIDVTDRPAKFTTSEIVRADQILRRLELAVFMGYDDDAAVAFAKPDRVIQLP